MTVVRAVNRDLKALGDRALATSALAETALSLAREMDKKDNSATSKSMCARALIEVLEQLRDLAPPKRDADDIDDLASRRRERQAAVRVADTAGLPRP